MDINELSNTLKEVHTQLLNYCSRTINLSVTVRNWLFGYFIQEYELNGNDRAKYGEKVVENLAKLLRSAQVPSSSYRHLNKTVSSILPSLPLHWAISACPI